MASRALVNPFPGLRPFEPDEDHLFFGRESETDDLLRRLRSHRFLSVVGTSGSGKSSLVRSGLIPSLHSGFMAGGGSSWRVSMMRPGEDPIGHLAEALDVPDVLGNPGGALATTNRVLLDATLRRSTLGLVDAIRLARISANDNVLILVDQFEELFRFRQKRRIENSRDEAVAFVKLLLDAANQHEIPIYVVLTMRSDLIGHCMEYPGLPEAVNEGQFLVPRMTRDELRSAITGPVAVAGATIAPRLVQQLLNDAGDNQDQLPLVQHVLMRTWDHWARQATPERPIDLVDYEAVGALRDALSRHAEEAFQETGSVANQRIAERIFKSLTDTFSDPRGVRRPTSVADLAAICEVPESSLIEIVEIFRRPGRSFLMPPSSVPLTSEVIVDLSHESLMRCWTRLIAWTLQERISSAIYVRLSRETAWFDAGEAGLWTDPELELGLKWRRESRPSAAWARRFDDSFDRAMQFLDRSEKERERQRAERRTRRIRYLQLAWGSAALLLVVLLVVMYFASSARRNLELANKAVDQTLAAADRAPELIATESPDTQALRGELLTRAQPLYEELVKQRPWNAAFLNERAGAYYRLGHIYRVLGDPDQARKEYEDAISQFDYLARKHPATLEYRQSLANAFNWLGETLRPQSVHQAEAQTAYGNALRLQAELVRASPSNPTYKQELARTHYNRGILYYLMSSGPGDAAFDQSETDFRDAVQLLEPLSQRTTELSISQDLARASNNLANVIGERGKPEARQMFERAIRIHEALIAKDPRNREYKFELSKFNDNLSHLLRKAGDLDLAGASNARALDLLDELARPSAALGIEQADAHNLGGRILQARGSPSAADQYHKSLDAFKNIEKGIDAGSLNEFHTRFGDLLDNLVSFRRAQPNNETGRHVLEDALDFYVKSGRRAAASGSLAGAQSVLQNLNALMDQLPERDRRALSTPLKDLQREVDKQGSKRD